MSSPAVPVPITTGTPIATSSPFHRVTWDDISPHFKFGLLITGSFVVAWGWDLVLYGVSHAAAGQNPLQDQISFGSTDGRAPKHALVLLLQYLFVCATVAWLSHFVSQQQQQHRYRDDYGVGTTTTTTATRAWIPAAVRAIEFFPSPFFAGKLMAYLSQFTNLKPLSRGLLNLAATWVAAILAHVLPEDFGVRYMHPSLGRFTTVVQNTLGFGLGIAWNVFLSQWLGPQGNEKKKKQEKDNDKDDSDFDIVHFIALGGYLMVVLVLSLKLAALKQQASTPPSLWDRHINLLLFAMQVVCAFTLVAFLDTFVTPSSWYGPLQAMALLLLLSAILSALVAAVDLESLRQQQQQQRQANTRTSSRGGRGFVLQGPGVCLLLCPCTWCCCPWIPVLVLLSGDQSTNHLVKEDWFDLVSMVTGLAASIEASNFLTGAMDALASGFCTAKHCGAPWIFVLWQVAVATLTTVLLLPAMAPLCQSKQIEDIPEVPSIHDSSSVAEKTSLLV